jgi:hypothetical protein
MKIEIGGCSPQTLLPLYQNTQDRILKLVFENVVLLKSLLRI